MLLIAAHSGDARTTLRNAIDAHESVVVRRFGRAVLLEETEFSAFLACRLRVEYGESIQAEQTAPLLPGRDVPADVQAAATAYATREERATPYAAFAANTDHPTPTELKQRDL